MTPLREAVKRLVEGVLVLGCAALVVTMVEGAIRIWQPHHHQATLLGWIAAALPAGALTVKLSTRLWLAPSIAALIYVIVEIAHAARWPTLHGYADFLPLMVSLSVWALLAFAAARVLKRWIEPVLHRHERMAMSIAACASLAAGIVVLLHLDLGLMLGAQPHAPGSELARRADLAIAISYALGGLSAGFTLSLLWPRGRRLHAAPVLLLLCVWCALAGRTLLEPHRVLPWLDTSPTSTGGAWPWLIPIAVAVLSGAWLARRPAGWRRDA